MKDEIPSWIFIIIGAIVLAFSLFINIKQGTNSMILFAILGGVSLGFGTVKKFIEAKSTEKSDAMAARQQQQYATNMYPNQMAQGHYQPINRNVAPKTIGQYSRQTPFNSQQNYHNNENRQYVHPLHQKQYRR